MAEQNSAGSIPGRLVSEIIAIARKHGIRKIILFGSRARGDNWERSDIDLAVSGGDAFEFWWEVEEDAWTLLMFDVVDMDIGITDDLRDEIDRDGIILYEEV